jgi:hypothetical protein
MALHQMPEQQKRRKKAPIKRTGTRPPTGAERTRYRESRARARGGRAESEEGEGGGGGRPAGVIAVEAGGVLRDGGERERERAAG